MGSMLATLAWEHPGTGWEGSHGGWWPVFPILWFLLLVGVAVTFAILYARRGRRAAPAGAAEAQLADRFARGDIDEQEYRDRLAVLRNARPGRRGRS